MSKIIILGIIVCISAYGFVEAWFSTIRYLRLDNTLNFKPFNCDICLSFWYTFGMSTWMLKGILVMDKIIFMGIVFGFVSVVINKALNYIFGLGGIDDVGSGGYLDQRSFGEGSSQ